MRSTNTKSKDHSSRQLLVKGCTEFRGKLAENKSEQMTRRDIRLACPAASKLDAGRDDAA